MPLPDATKLISVDDHLVEHGRVWLDRLPAKDREDAPHLVDDGHLEYWVYEDRAEIAFTGLAFAAGTEGGSSPEHFRRESIHSRQMIPGCMDPVARTRDMDDDGVWAQLCFPHFPRFAGTRFLEGRDKDLALRCVQAYNDFVIDEWCGAVPDRFIPLAVLPLWDPSLAAVEVGRIAERGARSISFPENPVPLGLPSIHTGHWDPVFAAIQDAGLPISMHFGTSGRMPITSADAPLPTYIALMGLNSMMSASDLIFSGVFLRFPGLRVALSEGGIGWIPYLKERFDYTWERQRYWSNIDKQARPSELFERHIYGCFIDDVAGIEQRHKIGVDKIMIETDYPHSDTSWPNSRKRAAEVLADVPDDEAHQIAEVNARTLYDFWA